MLKLERTAHDRQLNVIVNDKERFFTPPLLIAFAIAAVIHMLLFVIFQIAPLALRLNERIYPPMIVQVDPLVDPAAAVAAATSPAIQVKDHLPPLPPLKPVLPEVPAFITLRHMDEIKQNHQKANPFSQIEKDIYTVTTLATKPAFPKPDLTVVVSGPLATVPLVKTPMPAEPLVFSKGTPPYRVVYSVVADKAGKIIWHMQKESANCNLIDKLAEKMILEMQFAKSSTGFTTDGELELHFYNNEADKS